MVVYLTDEVAAGLARDLADRPDVRLWLMDLVAPRFVQWGSLRLGRQLSAVGASLRFAPEAGPDFFRPLGWEPAEVRSSWLEARRLGREPWLLHALWAMSSARRRDSYQNMGLYVLLGRGR